MFSKMPFYEGLPCFTNKEVKNSLWFAFLLDSFFNSNNPDHQTAQSCLPLHPYADSPLQVIGGWLSLSDNICATCQSPSFPNALTQMIVMNSGTWNHPPPQRYMGGGGIYRASEITLYRQDCLTLVLYVQLEYSKIKKVLFPPKPASSWIFYFGKWLSLEWFLTLLCHSYYWSPSPLIIPPKYFWKFLSLLIARFYMVLILFWITTVASSLFPHLQPCSHSIHSLIFQPMLLLQNAQPIVSTPSLNSF